MYSAYGCEVWLISINGAVDEFMKMLIVDFKTQLFFILHMKIFTLRPGNFGGKCAME